MVKGLANNACSYMTDDSLRHGLYMALPAQSCAPFAQLARHQLEAAESMAGCTQILLGHGKCRSVCILEYSSVLGDMLGRSNMPEKAAASDSGCISAVCMTVSARQSIPLRCFAYMHFGSFRRKI